MNRKSRALFVIVAVGLGAFASAVLAQPATNAPAIRLTPGTGDLAFPLAPLEGVQPNAVQVRPPQPPSPQPVLSPTHVPVATAPGPMPPHILAWDAEVKEHTVKLGDTNVQYTFYFTNVSPRDVTITYVQPSCGCTTVQLPPLPWKIPSGTDGEISAKMTIAAAGVFFKTMTVNTDKGWKMLSLKTTVQAPPPGPMTEDERKRNQELVKTDRQAVFKGDCARCHVAPAIGKYGKELYDSACGICHEAEHRASMVPDLHKLPHETGAEFWKTWISHGKEGSLMPAFAQEHGGYLSEKQIASLVEYLTQTIPAQPAQEAKSNSGGN